MTTCQQMSAGSLPSNRIVIEIMAPENAAVISDKIIFIQENALEVVLYKNATILFGPKRDKYFYLLRISHADAVTSILR